MEIKWGEVLRLAKEAFKPLGLGVRGLHYFRSLQHQGFSRKRKGVAICFDAETHNPHFFGKDYENKRRIALIDIAYEKVGEATFGMFPEHQVYLDVLVHPELPFRPTSTIGHNNLRDQGFVDVTHDNEVSLVEIESLRQSGEIEGGSTLDTYCQKYDLPHVLKHGRHYISPDISSVEAFEAICDMRKIRSVLEIGAGVGVCGVAAMKHGIKDFTFVDTSRVVCNYLHSRFPKYGVIQGSGLEFAFDRKYDVVLMGMPYELNPWFLAEKGGDLQENSGIVVFQSGCNAFFQFEHDWIYGKEQLAAWQWWRPWQTVPFYFPVTLEASFGWQTCVIASNEDFLSVAKEMTQRGFSPIKYEYPTRI